MEVGDRWPLGAEHTELRDELLAAYADPSRGYHDVQHLTDVLDRLDELQQHGVTFDPVAVRLAAWFHDAVYDGRPGAEDRSAQWAEQALTSAGLAPDDVVEVARLVRLTESHDPRPDDLNGGALCDADLAVLAADPDRYRTYVAGVRREYADVPGPEFRSGRAAVLRALLAKRSLFTTPYAAATWEPTARRNVTAELKTLERPAG